MKKTSYRVSKELKEQILKRIKEDGVSVAQAAEDHGITPPAIYNWLTKDIKGQPTLREMNRLKKENKALLELVGRITVQLSQAQKRADHGNEGRHQSSIGQRPGCFTITSLL